MSLPQARPRAGKGASRTPPGAGAPPAPFCDVSQCRVAHVRARCEETGEEVDDERLERHEAGAGDGRVDFGQCPKVERRACIACVERWSGFDMDEFDKTHD